MKISIKFLSNKRELLLISFLLLISGIAHAYNMFHYPFFENDEGTYMAQAWSFLAHGKLAPYNIGMIMRHLDGFLHHFGFSLQEDYSHSASLFIQLGYLCLSFILYLLFFSIKLLKKLPTITLSYRNFKV